ncbi:unnamed protein product, partial [Polarella glacialis]
QSPETPQESQSWQALRNGDGLDEVWTALFKLSQAVSLLWAIALAVSAAFQEVGGSYFAKKSVGNMLLAHLAPPLLIMGAARKAPVLAELYFPPPLVLAPCDVSFVGAGAVDMQPIQG